MAFPAFAFAMGLLGPFEPRPRLAAAVSGGPDSMALALLAAEWTRVRGGSLLALIVDHGLRREAGREAAETVERLNRHAIPARILSLHGLMRGSALAERARAARFAALTEACAAEGILHLLLGHHAADQAETVLIRALGGSAPAGMAAMSPLVEAPTLRILRPLLGLPPGRLREFLIAAGTPWAVDPSNADPSALRARLRLKRGDRDGEGSATAALCAAAAASAHARAVAETATAVSLSERVVLRPEGFATLATGTLPPNALSALIQTITGADFPPSTTAIAALAAEPKPATLAGARLVRAGRMGEGMLLIREEAAMQPPVPAHPGAVWDRRFRLASHARPPPSATIGALGADAAHLRRLTPLPSAVLRTLPALRQGETLLAVPHLSYPNADATTQYVLLFSPRRPAAPAPFQADGTSDAIGDA